MEFPDEFANLCPVFPFHLKKHIFSGYMAKVNASMKIFLESQAETVEILEIDDRNTKFHEIALTKFTKLRVFETILHKLQASSEFCKKLKPMPSLEEIISYSGFSSETAMRAILGNSPGLKKLECTKDLDLPDHFDSCEKRCKIN